MQSIKKIRNDEKRRQIIAKWMVSFAVTAAVVVTVIVVNQNVVSANFLDVKAVGNEIIYSVEIVDSDNRIASNSLQLEIKGSFEKYIISLGTGKSTGSQFVSSTNGKYNLAIFANLGFGRETLNEKSIEIRNVLSGAILSYSIDPSINLEEEPQTISYLVNTKYYDPANLVESAFLEYAIIYNDEVYPEPQLYGPNNLYYESIPVYDTSATTIIENIENFNREVSLRFIVFLMGEELPTILDETTFFTPYRFFSSLYPVDAGPDYIVFSCYLEGRQIPDMSLSIDLYFGETLISSTPITLIDNSHDSNANIVRVDGMKAETEYSALLKAQYTNPDTGEQEIKATELIPCTTTPNYSYVIETFEETETQYDVVIAANDPLDVISSVEYYFEIKDEEGSIIGYESNVFFEEKIGDTKYYSATIAKPSANHYYFEISITKMYMSYYYQEIIYTNNV